LKRDRAEEALWGTRRRLKSVSAEEFVEATSKVRGVKASDHAKFTSSAARREIAVWCDVPNSVVIDVHFVLPHLVCLEQQIQAPDERSYACCPVPAEHRFNGLENFN